MTKKQNKSKLLRISIGTLAALMMLIFALGAAGCGGTKEVELTSENFYYFFARDCVVSDVDKTTDSFGFIQSASANFNVHIYKKVECEVRNASFDIRITDINPNGPWEEYSRHVTLSADGEYEYSCTIELKDDAMEFDALFRTPTFTIVPSDMKGTIIISADVAKGLDEYLEEQKAFREELSSSEDDAD